MKIYGWTPTGDPITDPAQAPYEPTAEEQRQLEAYDEYRANQASEVDDD